jgi:hypothetical protein
MAKEIRLIGGAWRVLEGGTIKSYATYEDALIGGACIEDQQPYMTTDDIIQQLQGQVPEQGHHHNG